MSIGPRALADTPRRSQAIEPITSRRGDGIGLATQTLFTCVFLAISETAQLWWSLWIGNHFSTRSGESAELRSSRVGGIGRYVGQWSCTTGALARPGAGRGHSLGVASHQEATTAGIPGASGPADPCNSRRCFVCKSASSDRVSLGRIFVKGKANDYCEDSFKYTNQDAGKINFPPLIFPAPPAGILDEASLVNFS